MKLYEINEEMAKLFAQVSEDGEMTEETAKAIEQLDITKDQKIESTACYYKSLLSDANQIKAEIDILSKRLKSKTSQAEWYKNYLATFLQQNHIDDFESSKVVLTFRSSTRAVIDETVLPKKYFEKVVTMKPKTADVKDLLKQGIKIRGASLIERQNIQIK